jgi:hypothetical protein
MRNGNGTDILKDNALVPEVARVQKKITESADTISLRLVRADSRPLSYQPGQFNMLGLPGFKEAPKITPARSSTRFGRRATWFLPCTGSAPAMRWRSGVRSAQAGP